MGDRYIAADLTRRILDCAFRVHSELGPGLLESAYQACLEEELRLAELRSHREVPLKIKYRGIEIDCAYRADFIVEDTALLELKCVDRLMPIHSAQTLTYLKLSGLRVGLLMNFNSPSLQSGLRRLVL